MTSQARTVWTRKSRSALLLAAAAAVTACGVVVLRAQDQPQIVVDGDVAQVQVEVNGNVVVGGAINPDAMAGKDAQEGVFVRDSALAVEKFALAQKMERLKEWDKSADLYQEILDKYADRVVPSQVDKDKKIYQYTSVVKGVQEQLAKWPPEGRDVYRARYEATAQQMESARRGDLFTLNQILTKYFVTDTAKIAALRLIDVNLERGEFLAAARLGDQLLDRHPGLVVERPGVLYRTALAYHLANDEPRATERLARLRRDHAEDLGTVRGQEVVLAESLANELKAKAQVDIAVAAAAAADTHRMFGGDETRGRVSPAQGRPGAKLYSVALAKPDWGGIQGGQRQMLDTQFESAVNSGQATGVMPVTDRGELYFQDGRRVYAVSLESGVPLPGWAQTYGGAQNGRYTGANVWGAGRTQQLTLTLTDNAVLAVLGQPDKFALSIGMAPQGDARLVCLDRTTGAERWGVSPAALNVPKESEAVKALQFTGSPLVVGDNVILTARTNKPGQQFEDCWVVCFDLTDGRYRWSSYIASSSTPGAVFGMQQMGAGDTATHLAYADGRVYCMTNVGALAALDAYSGTITWLDIYPRGTAPQDPNNVGAFGNPFMNQQLQAAPRPWAQNPVMVQGGKVFVLPNEGKYLLVYDANTGVEAKRLRLSQLGDADTLLGVVGDRLIVAGERIVYCVNWPKYDEATFSQDTLLWMTGDNAFRISGRGFVTTDSVFVPFEDRLFRYDMVSGKAIDTYPSYDRPWDPQAEGPGNVIVTSDHVVIAGPTRVDVYTDLAAAKRKLDREVALAPKDPQPRLRYAEVMFVSGAPDATQKLDEAIALLGGLKAMTMGSARDRVFNDALTFARKSADNAADEGAARALQFFDRAASAANGPLQQVHYRLARARFASAQQDPATAVALYQQILADAQLRPVPLLEEGSGTPTQADAVAERAITALQATYPKVYDPFQQQAVAALEKASAGGRPAPLLDVAQVFPNSSVAPQAMLQAADAFETAKDSRAAIRVLRQMYFKYPTAPEKPQILEAMARNYLSLPSRVDAAAARLAQGASLAGGAKLARPLTLPGGEQLPAGTTFADALERMRAIRTEAAAARLPDFGIPLPTRGETREARWQRILDVKAIVPRVVAQGVDALAEPLPEFERPDRVVVWSKTDGLSIYATAADAAAPTVVGKSDAFADAPTGVAWLPDDVLLVWSPSQVALLSGKGGPASWKIDVRSLPVLEVARAGDVGGAADGGRQGAGVFNADVRIINRGNQRFILRNGGLQQQLGQLPQVQKPQPNAPEQVVEVLPVGDRAIVSTSTGRLLSADLRDGRIAWQTRLADRAFDRLAATEDFTVVKTSDETSHRLTALDSYTGQIRGTKSFNPSVELPPVNLALSTDGTLVYTKPDRLVMKDLYKPWTEREPLEVEAAQAPSVGVGAPAGPNTMYQGANGPDHLQLAEGRILALADSGSANSPIPNETYVRLHSLETGQPLPLRYRTPDGEKEVDRVLSAGTKGWDVRLRLVGPRLYVYGPQTLMSYNIDRPNETWKAIVDTTDTQVETSFRDAFVGKDFLVMLDEPAPTANAALGAPQAPQQEKPKLARLHMFGRYPTSPTNPAESGLLNFVKDLSEPAGFSGAWQAADGGFYYLTADGNLKLLPGRPTPK